MFISSCLTIFQLNLKNSEITKIKSFDPLVLRLRNTCAIGCAKKTAEKVFKEETFRWRYTNPFNNVRCIINFGILVILNQTI